MPYMPMKEGYLIILKPYNRPKHRQHNLPLLIQKVPAEPVQSQHRADRSWRQELYYHPAYLVIG